MSRIKTAFLSGTITDNPLSAAATTINSAALASLPAIASPDIAVLVLDPAGSAGAPEVVWVTAHTGSATSATIARAKEGTSAREHASTIPWVQGPTIVDIEEEAVWAVKRSIFREKLYTDLQILQPVPGVVYTLAGTASLVGLGWAVIGTNSGTLYEGTLQTGVASGNYVAVFANQIAPNEDPTLIARVAMNSVASQNVFVGFSNTISPVDANDRIGFRVTDGGNIIGVCDNGGTETTRDSGSPPAGISTYYNLEIRVLEAGTIVQFFIDGSQIGANVTTNIPTVTSTKYPMAGISTTTTAAKSIIVSGAAAWGEV